MEGGLTEGVRRNAGLDLMNLINNGNMSAEGREEAIRFVRQLDWQAHQSSAAADLPDVILSTEDTNGNAKGDRITHIHLNGGNRSNLTI